MGLGTSIVLDRLWKYCAEQGGSLCFYEINTHRNKLLYWNYFIYLVTSALRNKEINITLENYKGYGENETGRYLGWSGSTLVWLVGEAVSEVFFWHWIWELHGTLNFQGFKEISLKLRCLPLFWIPCLFY